MTHANDNGQNGAAEEAVELAPFNDELQCFAVGVVYDFKSKVGHLYIEDGGCCDMAGCISIFTRIDKNVHAIETFSGARQDTAYRKTGDDWRSA